MNFLNIYKTKWNIVGQSGNQTKPVQVKNVKNGNFGYFLMQGNNFAELTAANLFGKSFDKSEQVSKYIWPEIGQDPNFRAHFG